MSLQSRLAALEARQPSPHSCTHHRDWLRTLPDAELAEYEALLAQGPSGNIAARPPRFLAYFGRWHTWHRQIAPQCPSARRTQALLDTARRRRLAATGGGA